MRKNTVYLVTNCAFLTIIYGLPSTVFMNDEPKIVGGFEANKDDYPYAVSLRTERNDHFCGGTLIDGSHVLTAAHCAAEGYAKYVVVNSDSLDKGGDKYKIISQTIHPLYDPKLIKNDIAMLKISENVSNYDLSSFPGRLHSNLTDYTQPCYVMGWGLTKGGGKLSNKFKVAQVQPIPPLECEKEWKEYYNSNLICTSSTVNAACNGDSGGPLICEKQFAGIVSFGKPPCATGKPDMFTAVNSYNDWIDSLLNESL